MSFCTKMVPPIPPPTTNDLSPHQRAQLLRKAKKLEQILGATPRLLDNTLEPTDPIHVVLRRRPSQRPQTNKCRGSIDSTSSTSSRESLSASEEDSCIARSSHSDHSINSYHSQASTHANSINSCKTWPGRAKVMRLVMKAPTLEMISASPSPNNMSSLNSPRQSPVDRKSNLPFTQIACLPDEDFSLRSKFASLSGLRKQKMDRLRRKLGQNVPFDLVFPSSDAESTAHAIKECSGLLPPPTPRSRKSSGRISSARDSIAISGSVHRAKRQTQLSSTLKPTTVLSKPRQLARPLSFIVESPDEHGNGCAPEFGQPPKPDHNTDLKSEWRVSNGGTEIKLWSTRRGYEGWRSDCPLDASQTSLRISPPPPPLRSSTELKKPSSYRKPVPPIPDDCC